MKRPERQIVLDTETTGLEPKEGHRIIEIGCVEIVNRRLTGNHFHLYLNPERQIDAGAIAVHGISNDFLADKPRFADIAPMLLDYLGDAELIIHNAPFDTGFLNHELQRWQPNSKPLEQRCTITDSLAMARKRHPGQKNDLDTLCNRYGVNNSHRELHGALLDAEILASLYLVMTGGQRSLNLEGAEGQSQGGATIRRLPPNRPPLRVVRASIEESQAHLNKLAEIEQLAGQSVWQRLFA
ncbi:DNA polymerase III subunit epsilon [Ectothiorhodospiraceae bacterium BW-2]|nr:DNA polymerase III subunit epsilon [Ectothiorhodospiraceae bacterium BW-2]